MASATAPGWAATRVYGSRNRRSDYYEHIPEKLPYGSSSWWDQMVRENRGGNPGGGRD